jgi:hypothetical protein
MSNITVTSSTDSAEAVLAVQGGTVTPTVEPSETKPAPEDTPAETLEASEPQDESEELEAEEPEESSDDKPKKKNGVQKRLSKLTRQREDARKEAEYWKQAALEKQTAKAPEMPPTALEVKPDLSKRPVAESFETHEAYVEALADWKVEQRLSERDAKAKESAIKAEAQTKLNSFLSKRESFAKGHDDFFERMADIQSIPMSLTVNESLLESENGPELLYELAKDPDEYKRICSLPAIAAAREIGKFEARLQKSSDTETKTKTTKAPKPPQPVGKGSSSLSTKPLEEMDYADYKRAREQGRTS